MSLSSSGIENVRAYELPAGIRADGGFAAAPRTALVEWRCFEPDMFYQIYVNGRYAGSTVDCYQRRMIVQMPTSPEAPVRIEVFGVEPKEAHTDFCGAIVRPSGQSGRVRISLPRSQDLPVGATAQIYFDAGGGEIDYETPLNDCVIRIWPSAADKAGFGMSGFGAGDFGLDYAAGVGFGRGIFGGGQFGLDADMLEWVSPFLARGWYKFAIVITDEAGEKIGGEIIQAYISSLARPAERVSISSFDKQANKLVLSIS